jgi:hypothetical protein
MGWEDQISGGMNVGAGFSGPDRESRKRLLRQQLHQAAVAATPPTFGQSDFGPAGPTGMETDAWAKSMAAVPDTSALQRELDDIEAAERAERSQFLPVRTEQAPVGHVATIGQAGMASDPERAAREQNRRIAAGEKFPPNKVEQVFPKPVEPPPDLRLAPNSFKSPYEGVTPTSTDDYNAKINQAQSFSYQGSVGSPGRQVPTGGTPTFTNADLAHIRQRDGNGPITDIATDQTKQRLAMEQTGMDMEMAKMGAATSQADLQKRLALDPEYAAKLQRMGDPRGNWMEEMYGLDADTEAEYQALVQGYLAAGGSHDKLTPQVQAAYRQIAAVQARNKKQGVMGANPYNSLGLQ